MWMLKFVRAFFLSRSGKCINTDNFCHLTLPLIDLQVTFHVYTSCKSLFWFLNEYRLMVFLFHSLDMWRFCRRAVAWFRIGNGNKEQFRWWYWNALRPRRYNASPGIFIIRNELLMHQENVACVDCHWFTI